MKANLLLILLSASAGALFYAYSLNFVICMLMAAVGFVAVKKTFLPRMETIYWSPFCAATIAYFYATFLYTQHIIDATSVIVMCLVSGWTVLLQMIARKTGFLPDELIVKQTAIYGSALLGVGLFYAYWYPHGIAGEHLGLQNIWIPFSILIFGIEFLILKQAKQGLAARLAGAFLNFTAISSICLAVMPSLSLLLLNIPLQAFTVQQCNFVQNITYRGMAWSLLLMLITVLCTFTFRIISGINGSERCKRLKS